MFAKHLPTLLAVALAGTVAAATLLPTRQHPQAGDEHQALVQSAGRYEGTFRMWMPGMEGPMESPCTEVVTALGELWTTSRFEMEMMGMPFVGSSTLGYDPRKGKFVGTWIDNMTTSLTVTEGDWNEDKTAIVMEYDMYEPMMGETVRMKNVTTWHDDGYEIVFHRLPEEGEPIKTMEISMERAED